MSSKDDKLIILDSVDSTNNYAMGLIHSGMANSGIAVMALDQTAGKGRQGKFWESQKGENLTITFVEDLCYIPPYRQFEISVAASLACSDLFLELDLREVKIKWPNDIYYYDKKAGGILIENVIAEHKIKWTLIGIGINVNQIIFSESIKGTSIKLIKGSSYGVVEMAYLLNKCIQSRLAQLKNQSNYDWLEIYNQRLYASGKLMKLKKGNALFETTIKGVNKNGELITQDSIERTFEFNEIEWLLQ